VRRRLLNILTVLSLLLCVAVCVLSVRSYRVADVFERSRQFIDYSAVELHAGELLWTHRDQTGSIVEDTGVEGWHYRQESPPFPPMSKLLWREDAPPGWFNFAGFLFRRQSDDTEDFATTVAAVPVWPLSLLFAALPAARLYRRLHRRHPLGLCPRCGYNLTGNVSGVCPECGSPAETTAA
jgi:hypothetical protein